MRYPWNGHELYDTGIPFGRPRRGIASGAIGVYVLIHRRGLLLQTLDAVNGCSYWDGRGLFVFLCFVFRVIGLVAVYHIHLSPIVCRGEVQRSK